MSRATKDPTASEAISRLRFEPPCHAPGCKVNGGPRTHRLRGFWCPRCAHDRQEDASR